VLDRHAAGVAYDDAVETLHREWNEAVGHDWCHTISNAIVVALGLLYSEGDFATAICRAVQPGFDTDCNGATVGSIMGAALGRRALPRVWAEHIHDTLHTGVAGYHTVKLADITRATLRQIERVASA
jgi:ADP-ribosylglycohydrolase